MYAVIDIGSNTMRLVLYKLVDGEPRQMLNSKQAAGLAILEAVAERYQCQSFAASPYGVREGYLMYMLEEAEGHG